VRTEVATAVDRRRIEKCEPFEAWRQLRLARHARIVDEHRNDRDTPLEGTLELDPDRVGGIVDAAAAVPAAQPVRTDQRDQDIALAQRVGDVLAEIDPNGMASISMKTAGSP
jgi:hypothetical protein